MTKKQQRKSSISKLTSVIFLKIIIIFPLIYPSFIMSFLLSFLPSFFLSFYFGGGRGAGGVPPFNFQLVQTRFSCST